MEKDANYALVGLSTLILFAGLVIFVIWLARISLNRDYDTYDIIFQGPVRGLSQGGEVHFNGIKIGEVTKIQLARNPKDVIATARVTSNVPIRTDSYATLEPQGITGVNYIQITAGTETRPLLKDVAPKGTVPIIKSQRSALSDLLEGGGTVLTRTVEALDRVNRVLSDKNIKTFTGVLGDTHEVTTELKNRKALFAEAETALKNIDTAAQQITQLTTSGQALVDGEGRRSVTNVADAAAETEAAAKDLQVMLGKLDGPANEFATNGLPQLTEAVGTLQQTAASLDRLVRQVEANPRAAVSKAPAAEKEIKP